MQAELEGGVDLSFTTRLSPTLYRPHPFHTRPRNRRHPHVHFSPYTTPRLLLTGSGDEITPYDTLLSTLHACAGVEGCAKLVPLKQ